jgi:hypothetical protein
MLVSRLKTLKMEVNLLRVFKDYYQSALTYVLLGVGTSYQPPGIKSKVTWSGLPVNPGRNGSLVITSSRSLPRASKIMPVDWRKPMCPVILSSSSQGHSLTPRETADL